MHNVAKVTEVVGTSETSIEGWAKSKDHDLEMVEKAGLIEKVTM